MQKLPRVIMLDVNELAKEHNLPKCANVILLEPQPNRCKSSGTPISKKASPAFCPQGQAVIEMNLKALSIGYNAVQKVYED